MARPRSLDQAIRSSRSAQPLGSNVARSCVPLYTGYRSARPLRMMKSTQRSDRSRLDRIREASPGGKKTTVWYAGDAVDSVAAAMDCVYRSFDPDVVLTDYSMPVANGLELIRQF